MSEKDILYKGKIKQGGIFNFKDLYSFLYELLTNEGYFINEKSYSEKVAGDAKEVEIKWEAKKKVSDYFQFMINVNWRILGMKKVTIKKEGKEMSMDSGSLELAFSVTLIKDYEERWENQPFWKFMRGVYDRYIVRTRIEEYGKKAIIEVNELINECKAFLELEAKVEQ